MTIHRLAELAHRADVAAFGDQISLSDVLSWVQYWHQSEQRGVTTPEALKQMVKGLKGA